MANDITKAKKEPPFWNQFKRKPMWILCIYYLKIKIQFLLKNGNVVRSDTDNDGQIKEIATACAIQRMTGTTDELEVDGETRSKKKKIHGYDKIN